MCHCEEKRNVDLRSPYWVRCSDENDPVSRPTIGTGQHIRQARDSYDGSPLHASLSDRSAPISQTGGNHERYSSKNRPQRRKSHAHCNQHRRPHSCLLHCRGDRRGSRNSCFPKRSALSCNAVFGGSGCWNFPVGVARTFSGLPSLVCTDRGHCSDSIIVGDLGPTHKMRKSV